MYKTHKIVVEIPAKKLCKRKIATDTKETYSEVLMDKKLNIKNMYIHRGRRVQKNQNLLGMNIPNCKLAFFAEQNRRGYKKVSSNLTKL